MTTTYQDFLDALAYAESTDNYSAVNPYNYLGRYQMGEAALYEAGYINRDGNLLNNDYSGGWTGKDGVSSISDFLSNHTAQDNAIQTYNIKVWNWIENLHLDSYVGQTIGGTLITESGMIAGAHLVGIGGLKQFLTSNGSVVPEDGNNVPITNYISSFASYDTPFTVNVQNDIGIQAADTNTNYAILSGAVQYRDPLILDLDKDGQADLHALTSTSSRMFDVDEDGFDEHVGWVKDEDGFLCRDTNSDGQITEQSELFGNATTNGFTMLAALDSNSNGKIDNTDTAWSTLKVWQDANQDGVGQSGELQTLDAIGIKSISLSNSAINTNVGGNILTEEGTFTWTDNSTSKVWDATLATNDFWSRYSEEYELNPEVLFLPTARGYGNLPDLHIAMSINEDLLDMVKDFQTIDLSDWQALRTAAYDILVEWSGAVDKGAHPFFINTTTPSSLTSEQLWLLDAFMGNTDNIGSRDDALGSIIDRFVQLYTTRLVIDSQLKEVLPDLHYDLNADAFTGTVDYGDLIDAMEDEAPAALGDKVNYWRQMSAIVNEIATSLGTSSGVYTTLMNNAISATGVPLSFAQLSAMNEIGNVSTNLTWGRHYGYDYETATTGSGQTVYLVRDADDHSSTTPPAPYTSGDDLIIGVAGGFGAHGGAVMNGGDGHDTFIGTALNDVISTGNGNNTVYAFAGNDNVVDGSGNDTIYGGAGNDLISVSAGNDLVYGDEGNDTIAKSSTGTLEAHGGTGNDSITGNSGNDTLYGDTGDDTVTGGTGNDTLYGGDDNDTLTDTSGTDTLYGDDGNDTLKGGGTGVQYLYGGTGNDTLSFDSSGITSILTHKYQSGGDGNDTITISKGINHLDGGAGNDTYIWDWVQGPVGGTYTITPNSIYITDASGTDQLQFVDAGFGYTMERYNDDLYIYYSNYTITIANNFANPTDYMIDSISTSFGGGSTVDLYTWTPVSGENWTGTNSSNTHSGTGYSDIISGLDGNDSLSGLAGRDTIYGGNGNDTIDGGSQDDTLVGGTGDDTIYGGNGNDTYVFQTGDGIDFINNEGTLESFDDKVSITNVSDLSNIYFDTTSSGITYRSLDIYYGTSDKIAINSQLYRYGVESVPTTIIESLLLGGSTTVNLVDDVRYYEYSSAATLTSGATHDIVKGSSSADTLDLGNGNNSVKAGGGNDVITGGAGADWFRGEAGDDTLNGGGGNDKLEGGNDNDTYVASSGHDIYTETAGTADKITFGSGITSGSLDIYRVMVNASQADIIIDWGSGDQIRIVNPFLSSGNRIETIQFYDTSTLDLIARDYVTKGTASGETIYGVGNAGFGNNDTIYGYDGNDTLYGQDGNDTLWGGNGNDTLNGENNNDTLYGEAGTDTLSGGTGNDSLYGGDDNDTLNGNDGNDFLYGGAGVDAMYGGNNDDTLYGGDGNDTQMFGEAGNDTLHGEGGNDTLDGSAGNDMLYGGDGNDTLSGGNDNDTLDGGAGSDSMNGGSGDDTYIYSSGLDTIFEGGGSDIARLTGGVTINDIAVTSASGNVKITINSGVDELTFLSWASGATYQTERVAFDDGFSTTLNDYTSWSNGTASGDSITGNSSHNTIIGKAGNDTLDGAGGDDDIHGGADNDTLYGGSGTDLLHGGTGNDTLYGQDGLDTMYGGTGSDTFVFQAASAFNNIDVVKDFSTGDNDVLNVADLLVGYTSGSSNINDFVSLGTSGSDMTLYVDRDGTGGTYSSQQIATLSNVSSLNVDDLLSNGHLIAA